jgi:hypothetical protein
MTLISLRLPDHVIQDLKEVAPTLASGVSGFDPGVYLERAAQPPCGARNTKDEGYHRGGVQPSSDGARCAGVGYSRGDGGDEDYTVSAGLMWERIT